VDPHQRGDSDREGIEPSEADDAGRDPDRERRVRRQRRDLVDVRVGQAL